MIHINHFFRSTCSTSMPNASLFDRVGRFRESTLRTKNKLLNVFMNALLKLRIRVRSVHHSPVVLLVIRSLRSHFASKEFVDLGRFTVKRKSQIRNVDDHGLDSVSFSFNLSNHRRHFVTVGWIFDGIHSRNVDDSSRHDCKRVLRWMLVDILSISRSIL
jgi:hypothetical protein